MKVYKSYTEFLEDGALDAHKKSMTLHIIGEEDVEPSELDLEVLRVAFEDAMRK
jgi:hypothetical protein